MKANPSGPEGLAGRGASAALHGLSVEPTTARAVRLASAPSPSQRGSRGILRQAPESTMRESATRESEREVLVGGALEIGIDLDGPPAESLLRLVDELELANAQFNLTAIRDRPGMLRKHVLDSLTLLPHLRGGRVADVGTGAGFPG